MLESASGSLEFTRLGFLEFTRSPGIHQIERTQSFINIKDNVKLIYYLKYCEMYFFVPTILFYPKWYLNFCTVTKNGTSVKFVYVTYIWIGNATKLD